MKLFPKWSIRNSNRGSEVRNEASTLDVSNALRELHLFSDRELADIALGRSDLNEEGLRIAGTKRRR